MDLSECPIKTDASHSTRDIQIRALRIRSNIYISDTQVIMMRCIFATI